MKKSPVFTAEGHQRQQNRREFTWEFSRARQLILSGGTYSARGVVWV